MIEPLAPKPAVLGAVCGVFAWASVPKPYCSTRSISVVLPAGPPAGLGVNALAPPCPAATACVPSRTTLGLAITAGFTVIPVLSPM